MTTNETSLDTPISAREQLVSEIRSHLDERSKQFLLSFRELRPDWALLGTPEIGNLPAIRWKLMNLELLRSKQPEKYQKIISELEVTLSND
jgi:hypothetical protein